MSDFMSRISRNKGTSTPPERKMILDEEALATAEYIKDYIVNDIAPYLHKSTPLQMRVCITKRDNRAVTSERKTEKDHISGGRVTKSTSEIMLSEEAIYFRNRLSSILAKDQIVVGNWRFFRTRDRSSDDYGENFFSMTAGWSLYPEKYFADANVPIDPTKPYLAQYTYFFGHKYEFIQGANKVDPNQAGYLGFVVSFKER